MYDNTCETVRIPSSYAGQAAGLSEPAQLAFSDLLNDLQRGNSVLFDIIENMTYAVDRLLGSIPQCNDPCADKMVATDGFAGAARLTVQIHDQLLDRLQVLMGRLNRAI